MKLSFQQLRDRQTQAEKQVVRQVAEASTPEIEKAEII